MQSIKGTGKQEDPLTKEVFKNHEETIKNASDYSCDEQNKVLQEQTMEERFKDNFCWQDSRDMEWHLDGMPNTIPNLIIFIKKEIALATQQARQERDKEIIDLAEEGLNTDGAHHKDETLTEIINLFNQEEL